MQTVKDILKAAIDWNGSDIILKVGSPPGVRKEKRIVFVEEEIVTPEHIDGFLDDLDLGKDILEQKKKKEIDMALEVAGIGRFRASIFIEMGHPAIVLRVIKSKIFSFDELNLPGGVLQKLAMEKRGLILVAGATGNGKSTTISTMIEYMNQRVNRHIITIEDPIEFVFQDKKSIITQREIGLDTSSYNLALKHAMFQSPDVIYIGNIRDQATTYAALTAAETGHLVVSTVHSVNAAQTIERLVNYFPPYQHAEVRAQLAMLLKGIIAQRLLPRHDQEGVAPVCEVMIQTPSITRLVREGKTSEITKFMEEGELVGMQSFNQAIAKRFKEGVISKEVALESADSKDELKLAMQGITQIRTA